MMTLQGHVKEDLACVDNEKTVLASFDNFVCCENQVKEKREGAYGHFDTMIVFTFEVAKHQGVRLPTVIKNIKKQRVKPPQVQKATFTERILREQRSVKNQERDALRT